MIVIKHRGSFRKVSRFLNKMSKLDVRNILSKYGQIGVNALAEATPSRSGETASSWNYSIEIGSGHYAIYWSNSHTNDGVNIALILQMGHGTGTGGYYSGIDYINPALRPIFDQIAEDVWSEVTSA